MVEHDPTRLEEIRRRQDLLFRLRAKYGPALSDVIATLAAAKAELGVIESAGWEIDELTSRRKVAVGELLAKSAELTVRRKTAGEKLEVAVNRVLPELGMEGGRFEAVSIPISSPGPSGGEEIEFRVSLNKGFEPKPLATVASGGEMSRVMLALKTILAELDAVPTLIFDEVDAGVGGRVALQVGDKMREVARSHQVLAITHLPQIASRAHLHLLVAKESGTERTSTSLRRLDLDERVAEIARMLGGDPESATSTSHARELLAKGTG
jgi:DNA repair protein RecN (Recombination protein N)